MNTRGHKARAADVSTPAPPPGGAIRGDPQVVAASAREPGRLGQDLGYAYEAGALVPDGTPPVAVAIRIPAERAARHPRAACVAGAKWPERGDPRPV